MRWNPTTNMVQVCDDGTWYDKEYFNPHWDGYIYNNGEFDPNYIGTWSKDANTSYVRYENQQTFEIQTVTWSGNDQTRNGYAKREEALPQGYSTITVHTGTFTQAQYTNPPQFRIEIWNSQGAVLTQSSYVGANATATLDISNYSHQDVYLVLRWYVPSIYYGEPHNANVKLKDIRLSK